MGDILIISRNVSKMKIDFSHLIEVWVLGMGPVCHAVCFDTEPLEGGRISGTLWLTSDSCVLLSSGVFFFLNSDSEMN